MIGRERELEAVRSACRAAASGRGQALVVVGEPGIGKTTLLAAAEAGDDWDALRAVGVEAERGVAFASLQSLLWSLRRALDDLDVRQAAVLRSVLQLGPAVESSAFAVGAATLALVSVAAERLPLVLVLDDAQWADVPSQEALAFVGRRLERERVALLVGLRAGEPSLFADERSFPRIELRGLSDEEARRLLEDAYPELAPNVARQLVRACAGNPLGLLELAGLLTEAQRRGAEPLPSPLEAGPLVRRSFVARTAELSEAAREALLLLAAAGDADPGLLDRAGVPCAALDEAEAGGLIVRGERVGFRHPLIRSAVYSAASAAERRAAHERLAAVEEGMRRAWHLAEAAAGPDERAARGRARGRGGSVRSRRDRARAGASARPRRPGGRPRRGRAGRPRCRGGGARPEAGRAPARRGGAGGRGQPRPDPSGRARGARTRSRAATATAPSSRP